MSVDTFLSKTGEGTFLKWCNPLAYSPKKKYSLKQTIGAIPVFPDFTPTITLYDNVRCSFSETEVNRKKNTKKTI